MRLLRLRSGLCLAVLGVVSGGLFAADGDADPRAEISRGVVVAGGVSSSVAGAVSAEADNDTVDGVAGEFVVALGAEVGSGVAVLDAGSVTVTNADADLPTTDGVLGPALQESAV